MMFSLGPGLEGWDAVGGEFGLAWFQGNPRWRCGVRGWDLLEVGGGVADVGGAAALYIIMELIAFPDCLFL